MATGSQTTWGVYPQLTAATTQGSTLTLESIRNAYLQLADNDESQYWFDENTFAGWHHNMDALPDPVAVMNKEAKEREYLHDFWKSLESDSKDS